MKGIKTDEMISYETLCDCVRGSIVDGRFDMGDFLRYLHPSIEAKIIGNHNIKTRINLPLTDLEKIVYDNSLKVSKELAALLYSDHITSLPCDTLSVDFADLFNKFGIKHTKTTASNLYASIKREKTLSLLSQTTISIL